MKPIPSLQLCFAAGLFFIAVPASAQSISTQVFEGAVPFTYDRGRNESVIDRPHPEYDPVGVPAGGFLVFPSIDVDLGYTDNVYQANANGVADGFVAIEPKVRAVSQWSLHRLTADASGKLVRYFKYAARNEDGWSIGTDGRLDMSGDASLSLGARTTRMYESGFSGASLTGVRSAVPVQASMFKALEEVRFTRVRAVLAADYSILDYKPVQTLAGTTLSGRDRDRNVVRGIGHVEYGLTPDAGLFVQATYAKTNYPALLASGLPNRDSSEIRVLTGVSFDLTALLRGSLGIGYVDRRYESLLYKDISGISIDGKLEYFPSQLTTLTISGRRQIEDSTVSGTSGFFNTGVAARVDHELLRNAIVNIGAEYEHDDYIGTTSRANSVRISGGGQYLMSNTLRFDVGASYGKRTANGPLNLPTPQEFRVLAGVSLRR